MPTETKIDRNDPAQLEAGRAILLQQLGHAVVQARAGGRPSFEWEAPAKSTNSTRRVLEIPAPQDPTGPVVPDVPTQPVVPNDPAHPAVPDLPDGASAPEPDDPLPPSPDGPSVPPPEENP